VRPTARFVPVGDDRAVTASRDGSVLGVDLAGPRLAWRVVPEQVATSFDVRLEAVGDTVVASASGSDRLGRVEEVFAVSAATGQVLWRRKGAALTSLGGGVAGLLSGGGTVVVDLATGRELWSVSSGSTAAGRLGLATASAGDERTIADHTLALSGTDLKGQQVTVGVYVMSGRERWRLEGLRQPVALDEAFGVASWEGRDASDSRRWLGLVDAGTGRQRWQHQMVAEQYGEEWPAEHLAADPARARTVVADLPGVPQGGCY
jgi:outer membrane protein assembly factor BamB